MPRCDKRLHVSPFLGMDMHYRFATRVADQRLLVGVNAHDDQGPVLTASLDARLLPLTDAALLRMAVACPLLGLKVVAAIHWEALRLWLKGAPFHPHAPAPSQPVSFGRRHEPLP
jgi:DUF1365 family protein